MEFHTPTSLNNNNVVGCNYTQERTTRNYGGGCPYRDLGWLLHIIVCKLYTHIIQLFFLFFVLP